MTVGAALCVSRTLICAPSSPAAAPLLLRTVTPRSLASSRSHFQPELLLLPPGPDRADRWRMAAPLCPARRARTRLALLLRPLLWSLLATCCHHGAAQELPSGGVNGYSLHPPYFNLAEGTKITATATCGEEEGGRSVRDLYCKLVGGPVSGDPGQTIQVSSDYITHDAPLSQTLVPTL